MNSTGIGAAVVAGVSLAYALYLTISNRRRQNKGDFDKEDDRLLQIRGQTISELDRRIKEQTAQIQSLTDAQKATSDDIIRMRERNKVLEEVFQGRDGDAKRFQTQGFEVMGKAVQAFEIIGTIPDMNKNIERLAVAIESHLDILAQTQKTLQKPTQVTITK